MFPFWLFPTLFPTLFPFGLDDSPELTQAVGVSQYLRLLLPLEPRRWLTESALRDRRSPEDQALVLLIDTLKRRRSQRVRGARTQQGHPPGLVPSAEHVA
jgi:hypothetical protein